MTIIAIASTNPVKIKSVKAAFTTVFPSSTYSYIGLQVDSGVSPQPLSDIETLNGAVNRATAAKTSRPDADYWIGLEAGIEKIHHLYHSFAWIALRYQDQLEISRTATFSLPPSVSQLIDQGLELGHAIDQIYHTTNIKHHQGAVGLFTHNLIDRSGLYQPSIIIALTRLSDPNHPKTKN